MVFPLVITAQRNATHLHNHMPTMQRLQQRMIESRSTGDVQQGESFIVYNKLFIINFMFTCLISVLWYCSGHYSHFWIQQPKFTDQSQTLTKLFGWYSYSLNLCLQFKIDNYLLRARGWKLCLKHLSLKLMRNMECGDWCRSDICGSVTLYN